MSAQTAHRRRVAALVYAHALRCAVEAGERYSRACALDGGWLSAEGARGRLRAAMAEFAAALELSNAERPTPETTDPPYAPRVKVD
jgi:hypothetical protein